MFMADTRSATLSIRLKPETKKRLARLAKASGRSSNFLIADAVEVYVSDQERMLAEVRQADRQVKSGHYIRNEDMKAWLLSWGTDHELPVPNAPAAKRTTMRRCASRSCLVCIGPNAPAGNPRLRRSGQTGGGGTTAFRIVAMVEALRTHPHLGRVGAEPGIRELFDRRDTVYCLLPGAVRARYYQHDLAWEARRGKT